MEVKEFLLALFILIYGILCYIMGRTNFIEKVLVTWLNKCLQEAQAFEDAWKETKCQSCENQGWDMPECKECNKDNRYKWYRERKPSVFVTELTREEYENQNNAISPQLAEECMEIFEKIFEKCTKRRN